MRSHLLIRRYAQGLVGALRDEAEFDATVRELRRFHDLATTHEEFRRVLTSPFIPAKTKGRIVREILAAVSFSEKTCRFLLLLQEHNRIGLVEPILQILPVIWNESWGMSTFEVNSVVSLSEEQIRRLKAELERLEGRPVYLHFQVDPGIVAGLRLKKGHIVYDASVDGQLERIREKIIEGR